MSSPEATISPSSSVAKRVTFNDTLISDDGLVPYPYQYPYQHPPKPGDDAIELEEGANGKGKGKAIDGNTADWTTPLPKSEPRILGLRQKHFSIIAVTCLVIVAAVVGGVIGAVIAQKNHESKSTPTAPKATRTYAPFPTTARETLQVFPTKDHFPPVITKTPAPGTASAKVEST